jgi:thiamine-phosphate pyrophosphorylase
VSLPAPPVLVITDRTQARAPLDQVAQALFAAGCRWLLLRDKDLPAAERRSLLARLVACGRVHGAAVTVSADAAAARAAGAVGVHLPDGGDAAAARAVLGQAALIGYSAHDRPGAAAAAAEADYVTLSPVFASPSKPGYGPALGLDGLRAACRQLSVPVIALGGVTAANAGACMEAGAAGVAVMGEVMRAEDPARTLRRLLDAVARA